MNEPAATAGMVHEAPAGGRAATCRNCDAALAPTQKFCSQCGQRTDLAPRLTLHEIGHDVVHALLHVDRSIFALVRALLVRPGHVAREYLEGRRKRHFGPFAFLVIAVGLASAMILIFGVDLFRPMGDSPFAHVLSRHVNLVVLFQLPVLALFCWLFFFAEKLTFAEHRPSRWRTSTSSLSTRRRSDLSRRQLAQINVAELEAPLDSPQLEDFGA